MPIRSAITIAGTGSTGAITGAEANAATATAADNATPGAMVRNAATGRARPATRVASDPSITIEDS
jgi:hypothetical protein